MNVCGLTGGIGMGKSTSAQLLLKLGVPVTDTDDLAREVVEPGQPALEEIRKQFGAAVIGTDGRLLRSKLAEVVFADACARARLEAIVHPPIRELWHSQLDAWRREDHPAGVVVIPLLFETGLEKEFDTVICVACSFRTQQERLAARGWTLREIDHRIASQLSIQEKMARANHVIWTEGGMDVHAQQLSRIIPVE